MRLRPASPLAASLTIALAAFAFSLAPAPAASAAGELAPKAGSAPVRRGIVNPTLSCVRPFVASADGTGCVCPDGLVKQGNTCAPAARMTPSSLPSKGIQRKEGLTRQPSKVRAIGSKSGLGSAAGKTPAMAVQDQPFKLTPITTKAGEFGTILEVRTISSDVITTWGLSHNISSPQPLTFRWTTQANPQSARYRVSALTGGSPLLLQESQLPLPSAGVGIFSYPFPSGFNGFVVTLIVTDVSNEEWSSIPVHITYGAPTGETPTISLPKTVLKVTQIDMIDDSDDLSTGEIDFCFWATYSQSTTPVVMHHNGDFDSGTSDSPNVQILIDGTPKYITLHAKGRDDDLPPGGFSSTGCGGSTADHDFAAGSRNITLPTGAVSTNVQTFSPFMATGSEDLEFRVRGSWQVIP